MEGGAIFGERPLYLKLIVYNALCRGGLRPGGLHQALIDQHTSHHYRARSRGESLLTR